ncbi:hypothetical protein AVEN_136818-1 [Araneus ventricosus]|uniref:Uncharacterized protein n=1 Tax=Araneus ventricosus TaxID=182803 RepID=A0A4Y2VMY1_ARAVE|nr:hypothetical protein AVEN_149739-1 [Araneus ventricosus]GBL70271.1 hypothetical protein AVEN_222650-1 [Araneus ventricosus]GBO26655.1 hypothetical protein AVEN_66070-1 [Araneus ventricosus]GBO26687.1 hypothetical protein AVEN_136818-1 [Araneus ventricosus]
MFAPLEVCIKEKQRAVIRFLPSEGVEGSEIRRRLSSQYGGIALSRTEPLTSSGRIFTNPTLIELRQEIGQYDWLASPRVDDVVLCSCTEIITKQAIECGL